MRRVSLRRKLGTAGKKLLQLFFGEQAKPRAQAGSTPGKNMRHESVGRMRPDKPLEGEGL